MDVHFGTVVSAPSGCYGSQVTTLRRLVALVAGGIAVSVVIALPVAQGEPGNEASIPIGWRQSDAIEPPLEVSRLQRPTLRTAVADQVIDVHFFRSPGPYGPSLLTETYARELIAQADAWYDRVTRGALRLRFAGLTDTAALAVDPCTTLSLDPVWAVVVDSLPLSPGPGATGVTWIGVSQAAPGCWASGLGFTGESGMWMRQVGTTSPDTLDIATFAHELGHNLGLLHSSSYRPSPDWAGTTGFVEYGDQADIMGFGGAWDCRSWPCRYVLADMHAHNRNLLGALDDSSIAYAAAETGEFSIAPVDTESGTTAVYLPWLNRSKFVIDYRPSGSLPGAQDAEQGTGPGVYVRLVDSTTDSGPDPYTARKGTGAFAAGFGRSASGYIHGFLAGQGVTLPDGSGVTVVSITPSEARVRVTRPPDITPPSVGPGTLAIAGCSAAPCTLAATSALWGPRGPEYRVKLGASSPMTDDVWLSSVKVSVNGEVLDSIERIPNGRADSQQRLEDSLSVSVIAGTHSLLLEATDLAGNSAQASTTVIAPQLKPPVGRWGKFGSAVRYTFPGWNKIVPCAPGTTCLGLTVEALKPCKRGIEVVVDVKDAAKRTYATMRASSPPLPKGGRAFLFLEVAVNQDPQEFAYRSMTCR